MANVSELVGKTLTSIENINDHTILFITADGDQYKLTHIQDCCEDVYISDIEGDLQSLVGNPILVAEEVDSGDAGPLGDYVESYTWTFYKFATIKGHVDIRWYGSSNGYYSESVDFIKSDDYMWRYT